MVIFMLLMFLILVFAEPGDLRMALETDSVFMGLQTLVLVIVFLIQLRVPELLKFLLLIFFSTLTL